MIEIKPLEETDPQIANYLKTCIKSRTKMFIDTNAIYINKGSGFQQWTSVAETIGKEQGRNDPCNCGSGKKYKKCCGK